MSWLVKPGIFYIVFISIAAIFIGCGSSIENPAGTDENDGTQYGTDTSPSDLNVKITVDKSNVSPGEKVKLTATVDTVHGAQLIIKWVNFTEYGELSDTGESSVEWTAPAQLATEETRVEVILLAVAVISKVISVTESGVKTETKVQTATKRALLTVSG